MEHDINHDPEPVDPTTATPRVEHLRAGDVARASLVVVGIALAAYLLWRLTNVLLLAFLAVLLATAIEPLVTMLRRGPFSKGTGALAVYGVIVVTIGLIAYVTVPHVAVQANSFVEGLPARIDTLRTMTEGLPPGPARNTLEGAIDHARAAVRSTGAAEGSQIVLVGTTAARALVDIVTVAILAFYWLIERNTVKRALLRLVGPGAARDVSNVWLEVEHKWGGWIRGQLVLMLAVGVMAGLGYVVLGLPSPLLLAGWVAAAEIVPVVGPYIGFLPAVLVALTISPNVALAVLAYAIVLQQIEGNILVPKVMSRAAGISPLTVMMGILVGFELYGLAGSFLAVPVAAALQVIVVHLMRARAPEHAGPAPAETARR
jgi:predicted PurR-regulated permease PerM